MSVGDGRSRRRFLGIVGAGAAAGLAGCPGLGPPATPTDWPGTPDLRKPVPRRYRRAASQAGDKRDPERLADKAAVGYRRRPNDGNRCSDCVFYVPDMNGDGLGACSEVAGLIAPGGWCTEFTPMAGGGQ